MDEERLPAPLPPGGQMLIYRDGATRSPGPLGRPNGLADPGRHGGIVPDHQARTSTCIFRTSWRKRSYSRRQLSRNT